MNVDKGQRYLLSEGVVDTVAVYIILQRLLKPFKDWDACKLGIIDKDGNKIKNPVTAKEREAWDLLTKFIWNFKKIISKFVGKSKFAHYMTAAFLLRDNLNMFVLQHNLDKLNENELKDYNFTMQLTMYNLISSLCYIHISEKINIDNIEYYIHMYVNDIEKYLIENNLLPEQFNIGIYDTDKMNIS